VDLRGIENSNAEYGRRAESGRIVKRFDIKLNDQCIIGVYTRIVAVFGEFLNLADECFRVAVNRTVELNRVVSVFFDRKMEGKI